MEIAGEEHRERTASERSLGGSMLGVLDKQQKNQCDRSKASEVRGEIKCDLVGHCKELGLSSSYENRPQEREQGSPVRRFWK